MSPEEMVSLPVKPTDKQQAFGNGMEMLKQLAADAADEGKHDVVLDLFRMIQNKPGVRTTEFYVAMMANAAGFAMQFWKGHEAIGAALILVSTTIYTISRTALKINQQK